MDTVSLGLSLPDEVWTLIIVATDDGDTDLYDLLSHLLFVNRCFNKSANTHYMEFLTEVRWPQEERMIVRMLNEAIQASENKKDWILCADCDALCKRGETSHCEGDCDKLDSGPETAMVRRLNQRTRETGATRFICRECDRLLAHFTNHEYMYTLYYTEELTATFCESCRFSCTGCGEDYCEEMSGDHSMCSMHP